MVRMFQLMVIEDTIKAPPHSFNRDVMEVRDRLVDGRIEAYRQRRRSMCHVRQCMEEGPAALV